MYYDEIAMFHSLIMDVVYVFVTIDIPFTQDDL